MIKMQWRDEKLYRQQCLTVYLSDVSLVSWSVSVFVREQKQPGWILFGFGLLISDAANEDGIVRMLFVVLRLVLVHVRAEGETNRKG